MLACGAALGRVLAGSEGGLPLSPPWALLLSGELGAGKTTLTRGLVSGLPGGEAVRVAYVAARFAAKEAAAKALGTGFRDGLTFQCLEVRSLPSGKPELALLDRGQELADALGATGAHLSLTHGRDTACAVVVLER
ncbi:hypothetical protein JCM14635_23580 [Megalodesulfovibrio paquesii]